VPNACSVPRRTCRHASGCDMPAGIHTSARTPTHTQARTHPYMLTRHIHTCATDGQRLTNASGAYHCQWWEQMGLEMRSGRYTCVHIHAQTRTHIHVHVHTYTCTCA
jgi:hypothetical protein